MKRRTIALLGCGTVGRGLVELIEKNRALIAERAGVELTISKILVRDLQKRRPGVDPRLLTTHYEEVVANGADVVVEVIGGQEPARRYLLEAISAGKNVVTANKALLADAGAELFRAALHHRVRIGFEASVCGGIPIVRALADGLVGNRISVLYGIVNGTCNFILSRMTATHCTFVDALWEAQSRGFAEADPSFDINGWDAAQKLKILAELAFGMQLATDQIATEGIRRIELEDVESAAAFGCVIKHVAVAREVDGTLDLRVHPTLVRHGHPLAAVHDEFNAVLLKGDAVGEMLFYGKGAGGAPTASAVLSDIVDLVRNDAAPIPAPESVSKPVGIDTISAYYLRVPIGDQPGADGAIAIALGRHGIAIDQADATRGNVKIFTQACRESALRQAIAEIGRLPGAAGRPVVMRILEAD